MNPIIEKAHEELSNVYHHILSIRYQIKYHE